VKLVYSHPQALAQCREWLDRNLPQAQTVEVASTAAAAERALEDGAAAAVASELAGRLYDLPVLRERIEDFARNVTRFLIIGRRPIARTGRDKTSILLSIKDEVGALYRILEPVAGARLNLTRIESRPTRRRPWEYVFFVDFEGHQADADVQQVLAALRERCLFLKVLGSYPAA
jgi:chorismate mutase/prephenate dehydratase